MRLGILGPIEEGLASCTVKFALIGQAPGNRDAQVFRGIEQANLTPRHKDAFPFVQRPQRIIEQKSRFVAVTRLKVEGLKGSANASA
jgi:hypothetical protein